MSDKENLPDDIEKDDFVEEVDVSNIDDNFEDDDGFYGAEKLPKGKWLNIIGVICFLIAGLVGVWQFWLSGVDKYDANGLQTLVADIPLAQESSDTLPMMVSELPVTPVLNENIDMTAEVTSPQIVDGLPEVSVEMSEEEVSDSEFDMMANVAETNADTQVETETLINPALEDRAADNVNKLAAVDIESTLPTINSALQEIDPAEEVPTEDSMVKETSTKPVKDIADTKQVEEQVTEVFEPVQEEVVPNISDIIQEISQAEAPELPPEEDLQPIIKEELVEEVPTIVPETIEYGSLTPDQILERAVVVRPRPKNIVVVKKNSSSTSSRSILVAADRSLKQGSLGDALSLYEDVLTKSPRDTSALMGKALTLQKLNRRDKAIEAYDRVLDIDPNNLNAMTNLLSLTQGTNTVASINRLKEMETKNPKSAAIAGQLGMLYGEMKDVSNAARYYNKAQSLDPRNAVYPFNLAILSDRMGSRTKALEHYQKTLQLISQYGDQSVVSKKVVSKRINDLLTSN